MTLLTVCGIARPTPVAVEDVVDVDSGRAGLGLDRVSPQAEAVLYIRSHLEKINAIEAANNGSIKTCLTLRARALRLLSRSRLEL